MASKIGKLSYWSRKLGRSCTKG